MNTGTISHWPKGPAARKKEQMLPAHVHEQASRPRFKARGFRLTDREQTKPGPVRWIMRNGQPVPPDEQVE